MTPSTITGVPVQRDAEGFFIDPGQWTEEMADDIARENGVDELTDRHWIVIRLGGSMRTLGKVSGVPINGGTMTLNTSTVSGNTSSYNGGGIFKPATASTTAVQWGTPGSGPGEFKLPYGVAVDAHGHVYVADTYNNRIEKFTAEGDFLGTWGSYGAGHGQLHKPFGVAVDAHGHVYVADTYKRPDREVHRRRRLPRDLGELRVGQPAVQVSPRRRGRRPGHRLRRRHQQRPIREVHRRRRLPRALGDLGRGPQSV